jgi:hypothetical protein
MKILDELLLATGYIISLGSDHPTKDIAVPHIKSRAGNNVELIMVSEEHFQNSSEQLAVVCPRRA